MPHLGLQVVKRPNFDDWETVCNFQQKTTTQCLAEVRSVNCWRRDLLLLQTRFSGTTYWPSTVIVPNLRKSGLTLLSLFDILQLFL